MLAGKAHTRARIARFSGDCARDALRQALEDDGVAVVEDALTPAELACIRAQLDPWFAAAPTGEGRLFGRKTRRFGGVFAKAPLTAELAAHPVLFSAIDGLLKGPQSAPTCDAIELNLTQAIAIEPGEPAQVLHRDEALWPVRLPYEIMANVMWVLDDFTMRNGATRVIPGSHRWDRSRGPTPGEAVPVSARAGSAILWVGGLLHGGGANMSNAIRHGLVISYRLAWLAPAEKLLLSVPPECARTLPLAVQRLLGYQLHKPNLGWVEGQDPIRWLHGEVRDLASCADNLTPAAQAAIDAIFTTPGLEGYRT